MTEFLVHRTLRSSATPTNVGYLTEEHPRLDRLQNGISAICAVLAGASILAIVVLTLVEALSRTAFSSPLGWSVGFIEQYLLTATAFFGIVTAYRSGAHVAVVSVYNKLGERARKVCLIVSHSVVIIGMLAIGLAGLDATIFAITSGEGPVPGSSEIPLPSWVWRSIVPIAMAMGLVVVIIDLYRELFSPWDLPATHYDSGDAVDSALEEAGVVSPNELSDPDESADPRKHDPRKPQEEIR
ncbi:TRAP transporter small permease subunit [Gordonia sp. zg691]|uniref:TRAP transporter small permease subunit n=1 Tax=Gordonia jinghuaiqii TaxID=2758710 RepID=A0A7D7QQ61_9ACTN|nr:TRAP transporter small permease subunit [Gordonia jinghuaiqii]MBD0863137.1 TRAP transporter small permease subunit [Gordonia jinghuaiqii]MCR5980352.1 TRAP transporter small permease subunit [Gordonia jinghuaiqii]QMT01906.1 TRAP transporter small permease subunit [Gordonia jinghuaiqii]